MTLDRVACDLTMCFATGQAYVALSRCKSLDGLYLLDEVTESIMRVDSAVMGFYVNLELVKGKK